MILPVSISGTGDIPKLRVRKIFICLFLAVRRRMMQELGIRLSFSDTIASANFIFSLCLAIILASGGELIPVTCGTCYLAISYVCAKHVIKRVNDAGNEE